VDWSTLRDEFPVTRRWAFFDHAAVAPLTARCQRAMHEWIADLVENGDVHHAGWMSRVDQVRVHFGQLLNADPLDLAFIKNTSEGIGIVAEGFPWQPGDNVVTAEDEYPANQYPWLNLARRGVEVRRVPSRQGRILLDDLAALVDGRTRIVSLSWVEFATGFRNDIDAIGRLCRERGVLFFLDAIQGLGVFPFDVQKTPVDFLAADGHKWLLGPEGAGVLYVRRELVDRLHAIGVGWNSVVRAQDFSHIDFTLKPHAGRWESGSLNVAGIMGLGASLGLLQEIGMDQVEARLLELTDHLCAEAERAGWKVFSSRLPSEKSAIVSLETPGDARKLMRACRDRGVVINQRGGRLRVSPHVYNSFEEIGRLLQVLGDCR
jgi:selenocysteine lyase/cysteine desulfurase